MLYYAACNYSLPKFGIWMYYFAGRLWIQSSKLRQVPGIQRVWQYLCVRVRRNSYISPEIIAKIAKSPDLVSTKKASDTIHSQQKHQVAFNAKVTVDAREDYIERMELLDGQPAANNNHDMPPCMMRHHSLLPLPSPVASSPIAPSSTTRRHRPLAIGIHIGNNKNSICYLQYRSLLQKQELPSVKGV